MNQEAEELGARRLFDVIYLGIHAMSDQHLVIRPGRRIGWWIDGRSTGGRRFMYTWWPTRRLASMVACCWARLARRAGRREVVIEEHLAER
jgi:hypothetical protein